VHGSSSWGGRVCLTGGVGPGRDNGNDLGSCVSAMMRAAGSPRSHPLAGCIAVSLWMVISTRALTYLTYTALRGESLESISQHMQFVRMWTRSCASSAIADQHCSREIAQISQTTPLMSFKRRRAVKGATVSPSHRRERLERLMMVVPRCDYLRHDIFQLLQFQSMLASTHLCTTRRYCVQRKAVDRLNLPQHRDIILQGPSHAAFSTPCPMRGQAPEQRAAGGAHSRAAMAHRAAPLCGRQRCRGRACCGRERRPNPFYRGPFPSRTPGSSCACPRGPQSVFVDKAVVRGGHVAWRFSHPATCAAHAGD
jgi:hypothetical protein